MSLLQRSVLAVLPHVPRALMRRLSARYIAGEELEQALERIEELGRRSFSGILDILGEDVGDEAQARQALEQYRRAGEALAARRLDAYVSVKPTHFGLKLSEGLALDLFRDLAAHLSRLDLFLRVEMEDHSTTDATLRLFEKLRMQHENVGIVLQARLLRTPADIRALALGPLSVRMVKGIYLEPARIAHVEPDPIRAAYLECSQMLLARGARVSFATHDAGLGERVIELLKQRTVAAEGYEFQVLLGVQERLWSRWQAAGHKVRVYVPYGPEWLAYSLRRLRKNPQILGYVMRSVLTPASFSNRS